MWKCNPTIHNHDVAFKVPEDGLVDSDIQEYRSFESVLKN